MLEKENEPRRGQDHAPDWTERRLIPLAPRTLKRLEAITERIKTRSGVNVEPMQLAGLRLEKTTEQLSEEAGTELALKRSHTLG